MGVFVCMCLSGGVCSGAREGQKSVPDALELEVQGIESHVI